MHNETKQVHVAEEDIVDEDELVPVRCPWWGRQGRLQRRTSIKHAFIQEGLQRCITDLEREQWQVCCHNL